MQELNSFNDVVVLLTTISCVVSCRGAEILHYHDFVAVCLNKARKALVSTKSWTKKQLEMCCQTKKPDDDGVKIKYEHEYIEP